MTEIDDMQRFTELYDTHHRQVYGYTVSRAGRQSADEIVSDTFLIAWRRFGELPSPELPWLLGVARNLIREQVRRSARQESIEAELRTWTSSEPDEIDPGELVTHRDAVLGALAGLSADDRELLTLVAWHGLTPREAARVIGCSAATYFVRLHRARRRLEQAMDGPGRSTSEHPTTDERPTPAPVAIPVRTPRKDITR